jgi:hypothetical protein
MVIPGTSETYPKLVLSVSVRKCRPIVNEKLDSRSRSIGSKATRKEYKHTVFGIPESLQDRNVIFAITVNCVRHACSS